MSEPTDEEIEDARAKREARLANVYFYDHLDTAPDRKDEDA